MTSHSPVFISLRKDKEVLSQPTEAEQQDLIEQYAQYWAPYNPLVYLAYCSLPELCDLNAKIQRKITATDTANYRFRFHPLSNGICLELITDAPCSHPPQTYRKQPLLSRGFENILFRFFFNGIGTIVSPAALEAYNSFSHESFSHERHFLIEQMMYFMAEQHKQWMQGWAARRERFIEQRERERADIKKDEERKQELRLAIQRVEEPKRHSQRMTIQKEETVRSYVRAHRNK